MIIDAFVLRALAAGLMVALAAGPLGCFVVWRRMAYFGDATAHAAILGVAMSLGFGVSIFVGTLVTALAMALTVSALAGRGWAMDTTLGVLAHAALALGLVAASFLRGVRVDLEAFLFGDILTVQASELWIMGAGTAAVTVLMALHWEALLATTISEDLARSMGLKPERERLILTLALALAVAVALKVVGALLIGALLVIPPATARALARTPERMALGAVAVAGASVALGLTASLWLDTPAGPSIVTVAAGLFVLSLIAGRLARA